MDSPHPLVAKGLHFSYPGQDAKALNGVNIEVRKGEVVVVTGPSGCGKSTLGRGICGLLPHGRMKGSVTLSGKDLAHMAPYDVGRLAGYVHQDPEAQLVTLRVDEEVAFCLENMRIHRDVMRLRVREALASVGASNLIFRGTDSLSGGEKQRVAIASLLALCPRLLVLDEPSSSLDPPGTAMLARMFGRLAARGTAIVILEHRIGFFTPLCDRLLTMRNGRVVSEQSRLGVASQGIIAQERAKAGIIPSDETKRSFRCSSRPRKGGMALIDAKDVRVVREGRPALKGVDLRVESGEVVGVMGANGCGKTTLALCLMNLIEDWKGEISMAGKSIRGEATSELARTAGLVFQNPDHQLFEATVEREIAIGPEMLGNVRCGSCPAKEDAGDCRESHASDDALETLKDRFDLLPLMDRAPHSLSHGQKRRVGLAAVAALGQRILILDEPFIGQDRASASEIMRYLRGHADKGGASLVMLHDTGLASDFCDRISFMESGRLIFDLPSDQALERIGTDPALSAWRVG